MVVMVVSGSLAKQQFMGGLERSLLENPRRLSIVAFRTKVQNCLCLGLQMAGFINWESVGVLVVGTLPVGVYFRCL